MLDRQYDLTPLQDAINSANHLAILFAPTANLDAYAAGIALASGLNKIGRTTSLIASDPVDSTLTQLIPAATSISNQLSPGDLVVSFPYQEGAIDKVSYHIDDGKFNLVIKPKPGFPPITKNQLNFSEAGPEPDLYIILNLESLSELGSIYTEHQERITPANIIQFSTTKTLKESQPAKVSISDNQASSLTEVIYRTLHGLSIKLDPETATQIILGIEAQTNGLNHPNLSPDAFTIIAECLRAGGTRYLGQASPQPLAQPTTPPPPAESANQPTDQPVTLEPMSVTASKAQAPEEPSWVQPVSSA